MHCAQNQERQQLQNIENRSAEILVLDCNKIYDVDTLEKKIPSYNSYKPI